MGRWPLSSRETVEECKCLDIFWLKRQGFLLCSSSPQTLRWKTGLGAEAGSIGMGVQIDPDFPEQNHIKLSYTVRQRIGDEKEDFDYQIQLVKTPCNYGKYRYWFLCPLTYNGIPCERRVAKLYLPGNAKYFGCRNCYDLTYRSCKEHDSRVSALLKLSQSELGKALLGDDSTTSLVRAKASIKLLNRFLWFNTDRN